MQNVKKAHTVSNMIFDEEDAASAAVKQQQGQGKMNHYGFKRRRFYPFEYEQVDTHVVNEKRERRCTCDRPIHRQNFIQWKKWL